MFRFGNQTVRLGIGLRAYMPPRQTIELAQFAEQAGFDHLWCSNEKLNRDMWIMLGLVAANTQRATLGPFVADPYTYHPALIASACATLDEATDGRAILLLGAGGTGFAEMGIQRAAPASALGEAVKVIRAVFQGQPATMQGKVIFANGARLHYPTRADLPIWIASRGNRVLKLAGRVADGVMIGTYAQPTGIRAALRQVHTGCAAAGRKPEDVNVTVRVDVCIDSDAARARDAVKPMIAGVIRISYPDQTFVQQAGLALPEPLRSLIAQGTAAQVQAAAREMLPEEFVDAFAWAGTPEQVAAKIAGVLDAGFTNLCIVPVAPAGSSVRDVSRVFVEQVLPRIQAQAK